MSERGTYGARIGAEVATDDPIFVDVRVLDRNGSPTDQMISWPTRFSAAHGGVPNFLATSDRGGEVFVWHDGQGRVTRTWQPTWPTNRHPVRAAR